MLDFFLIILSSSKVKEPQPQLPPCVRKVGLKCKPRSSKFFNWELFIMSDIAKKKKKKKKKKKQKKNKHSLG